MRTGSSANAADTWRMNPSARSLAAIEGIDQVTVLVFGKGIYRQIATAQVFFDSHAWVGIESEAVIADGRFSLGPCQRVLFMRFRVQKNREILADGLVTKVEHFVGRRADNTPVPFFDRNPELFVSNSATDEVHLHAAILANRAV